MKKLIKVFTLGALLGAILSISGSLWAKGGGSGLILSLPFSYQSQEVTTNSVTVTSDVLLMDVNIGYIMGSGLYLGGIYINDKIGDNGDRKGFGASIGYFSNWWVKFNYFLSVAKATSASASLEKGSGMGLDFGYNFMLSSMFAIGPSLSWRQITYTENQAGAPITGDYKTTDITPYINLAFYF